MGMGFVPTWLRQMSPPPLLHMTALTTAAFYRPDAFPVILPTTSEHLRKKYHTAQTCSPQAHLGFPILSLTTKGSWLP